MTFSIASDVRRVKLKLDLLAQLSVKPLTFYMPGDSLTYRTKRQNIKVCKFDPN